MNSTAEIVTNKQNEIIKQYIDLVGKDDIVTSGFLARILTCTEITDEKKRFREYGRIAQKFLTNPETTATCMAEYAKLTYIARAVRKVLNAVFFSTVKHESNHPDKKPPVADVFEYILGKLAEQNVSPQDAHAFFMRNARVAFSLTAHPTNPTSVQFTQLMAQFEKSYTSSDEFVNTFDTFDEAKQEPHLSSLDAMADNEVYRPYSDVLREIHFTPITGSKKKPLQEMEETIIALNGIYDAILPVRQRLIETLQKYPQYAAEIDPDQVLTYPSVWACGDGDGNPNATKEALEKGIQLLRHAIKHKYLSELSRFGLPNIAEKLVNNTYNTPEAFINDLEKQQDEVASVSELIYKVRTFGFHYATIDLRHNSDDLNLVLEDIVSVSNMYADTEGFHLLGSEEKHQLLSSWLQQPECIARLKATITPETLSNPIAKRIFGRLQVIAANPDMCEKLIIAENKTASDVLTAMFLLKISGNKVAEPSTNIDIVTLSESVADLDALPELLQALLEAEEYRRHIAERGYIMPMIAKSDTVRRDGRGAEFNQAFALGRVYGMLEDIIAQYPELEGICIRGFNGGGAALQRGGGVMEELGHLHGIMQRMYGSKGRGTVSKGLVMGPSTLTIQGHQCSLLFNPVLVAANTLESFIVQNWYAAMQTAGLLQVREPATDPLVMDAYDTYEKICAMARHEYRQLVGNPDNKKAEPGNQAFNHLYEKAPWISVNSGNKSSRPSKRGATASGEHPIALELRGKNPRLLENRAITVERITAHSGLFTLTYLGMLPGLLAYRHSLHNTYENCKIFRDFMRITAIALHMVDFEHAWKMLTAKPRPSEDTIFTLAIEFEMKKYHTNTDLAPERAEKLSDCTLAWLEVTALKTAFLVKEAIMGDCQKAEKQSVDALLRNEPSFTLRSPLQEAWPDLAKQLAYREGLSEFARFYETILTHCLNNALETPIDALLQQVIDCTYAAADLVNAPDGGLNLPLTRCLNKAHQMEHRPLSRTVSFDELQKINSAAVSEVLGTITPHLSLFKGLKGSLPQRPSPTHSPSPT